MKRSEDAALDLRAMQHALGLDPEDGIDPARRAEFDEASAHWAERFAPLLDIAEPITPSDALWRRIAADTVERSPRPAATTLRERLWASLALWRFATATAVAAALMLALVGLPGRDIERAPILIAVLQSPDAQKAGFLVQVAADRSVRLTPLGTTSVPAGNALQFWTKADPDPGPTSLGLVPGDAMTRVTYEKGALGPGQLFEVTLEPAGGSPIGRPTGPILFVGRALVPAARPPG